MAKGIEAGLVRSEFVTLRIFESFTANDDTVAVQSDDFLDAGKEFFRIECDFGQEDDMGRIGGVSLFGKYGSSSDPTGGASHDLNDAARSIIGGHRTDIETDLHHGGAVVFDDAAITGAVVGTGKVVIDSLRNTHDAHFVAPLSGFEMDFVGGILGVIAAGVEEVTYVVGFKDLEQAVHISSGLFGFLFEVEFVAARAEGRGRCVPETLNVTRFLVVEVDEFFIEDAENAIEASVDFLDAFMMTSFLDHACDACVDHGGGAARLGDEKISVQFCHKTFGEGACRCKPEARA